jgi:HSP20 family molecular chaperone IbpA
MADKNLTKRNGGDELEQVEQRPVIAPPVDVFENADEILLVADLPGVDEKNLVLDVDKDHLTLVGRRAAAQAPGVSVIEIESRELDYRRSFKLPDGLDAGKASAELKMGVLRIRVPKAPAAKPHRISVRNA